MAYVFSIVTLIATWLLLIIGGLVNPMGASMACPDWYFFPTCNGEILPEMSGGVLYEHGHRLVASVVGICTLLLTVLCLRSKVDRTTKKIAFLALFLVILQGTLGGITVLMNLSAVVSTMHLLCAMIFFALLVTISFRLSPLGKPKAAFVSSQWGMLLAIIVTLIQLVYGGVVRHLGAGMACGDDLMGCGPSFWPVWALGQLHMGHRILGYLLFAMVLFACARARRLARFEGQKNVEVLALIPVLITFCQIGLGLMTIYTVRSPAIVAMHTGFGGLLLASLLTVYLMQLPVRRESLC